MGRRAIDDMDVAIRDATVAAAGGENIFAHLRAVDVLSVEIELTPELKTTRLMRHNGSPYSANDPELRDRLNDEGVCVAAILVMTDFSGPHATAHAAWTAQACWAARELNAPVVRVDPLNVDKSLTPDEVRRRFVAGMREVLRLTDGLPIDLGIENHGPIANDPAWLDAALAEINDPRVGLTLDTGNFFWFGFPLEEMYRLLEKYAGIAKHTHLKNIQFSSVDANRRREIGHEYKQRCCPLNEGNLDLRRIVSIFRAAGYSRTLCIEDESLFKVPAERKLQVLRQEADALKIVLKEEAANEGQYQ